MMEEPSIALESTASRWRVIYNPDWFYDLIKCHDEVSDPITPLEDDAAAQEPVVYETPYYVANYTLVLNAVRRTHGHLFSSQELDIIQTVLKLEDGPQRLFFRLVQRKKCVFLVTHCRYKDIDNSFMWANTIPAMQGLVDAGLARWIETLGQQQAKDQERTRNGMDVDAINPDKGEQERGKRRREASRAGQPRPQPSHPALARSSLSWPLSPVADNRANGTKTATVLAVSHARDMDVAMDGDMVDGDKGSSHGAKRVRRRGVAEQPVIRAMNQETENIEGDGGAAITSYRTWCDIMGLLDVLPVPTLRELDQQFSGRVATHYTERVREATARSWMSAGGAVHSTSIDIAASMNTGAPPGAEGAAADSGMEGAMNMVVDEPRLANASPASHSWLVPGVETAATEMLVLRHVQSHNPRRPIPVSRGLSTPGRRGKGKAKSRSQLLGDLITVLTMGRTPQMLAARSPPPVHSPSASSRALDQAHGDASGVLPASGSHPSASVQRKKGSVPADGHSDSKKRAFHQLFGLGSGGRRQVREQLQEEMLKALRQYAPVLRLDEQAVYTIGRCVRLFFLSEFHAPPGGPAQSELIAQTMGTLVLSTIIRKISYPHYDCPERTSVFPSRAALVQYEVALDEERQFSEALEVVEQLRRAESASAGSGKADALDKNGKKKKKKKKKTKSASTIAQTLTRASDISALSEAEQISLAITMSLDEGGAGSSTASPSPGQPSSSAGSVQAAFTSSTSLPLSSSPRKTQSLHVSSPPCASPSPTTKSHDSPATSRTPGDGGVYAPSADCVQMREHAQQLLDVAVRAVRARNARCHQTDSQTSTATSSGATPRAAHPSPFLLRYTADYVYTRLVGHAVPLLEREKDYFGAVALLCDILDFTLTLEDSTDTKSRDQGNMAASTHAKDTLFLTTFGESGHHGHRTTPLASSSLYCPSRRGGWWNRLCVDLSHLNRLEDEWKSCSEGLVDPTVPPLCGERRALEKRLLRLWSRFDSPVPSRGVGQKPTRKAARGHSRRVSKSRKAAPPPSFPSLTSRRVSECVLTGRLLNRVTGQKSVFAWPVSDSDPLGEKCRARYVAAQEYAQRMDDASVSKATSTDTTSSSSPTIVATAAPPIKETTATTSPSPMKQTAVSGSDAPPDLPATRGEKFVVIELSDDSDTDDAERRGEESGSNSAKRKRKSKIPRTVQASLFSSTLIANKLEQDDDSSGSGVTDSALSTRPRDGVGVEEVALLHYSSKEGGEWRGLHQEGAVIRTVFGLLMWDVLFNTHVPGAFQTPFQDAPLDLGTESFVSSRSDAMSRLLRRLRACVPSLYDSDAKERGGASNASTSLGEHVSDLIATAWEAHKGTICRGVQWDMVSKRTLMGLAECIGGRALANICAVLAQDYRMWCTGFPDLILWDDRGVKLNLDGNGKSCLNQKESKLDGNSTSFDAGHMSHAIRGASVTSSTPPEGRGVTSSPPLAPATAASSRTQASSQACIATTSTCSTVAIVLSDSESDGESEGSATRGVPSPGSALYIHPQARVKFVEVKGPRDRLSDRQSAWIEVLLASQLDVEVCRVEEL